MRQHPLPDAPSLIQEAFLKGHEPARDNAVGASGFVFHRDELRLWPQAVIVVAVRHGEFAIFPVLAAHEDATAGIHEIKRGFQALRIGEFQITPADDLRSGGLGWGVRGESSQPEWKAVESPAMFFGQPVAGELASGVQQSRVELETRRLRECEIVVCGQHEHVGLNGFLRPAAQMPDALKAGAMEHAMGIKLAVGIAARAVGLRGLPRQWGGWRCPAIAEVDDALENQHLTRGAVWCIEIQAPTDLVRPLAFGFDIQGQRAVIQGQPAMAPDLFHGNDLTTGQSDGSLSQDFHAEGERHHRQWKQAVIDGRGF